MFDAHAERVEHAGRSRLHLLRRNTHTRRTPGLGRPEFTLLLEQRQGGDHRRHVGKGKPVSKQSQYGLRGGIDPDPVDRIGTFRIPGQPATDYADPGRGRDRIDGGCALRFDTIEQPRVLREFDNGIVHLWPGTRKIRGRHLEAALARHRDLDRRTLAGGERTQRRDSAQKDHRAPGRMPHGRVTRDRGRTFEDPQSPIENRTRGRTGRPRTGAGRDRLLHK